MSEGRLFALFGHPVSHSLSPVIHAAAYDALGLSHRYIAVDLPTADDVTRAFVDLRLGKFGGANVTIPHKRLVYELSDVVEPSAQLPGVANVLCVDDSKCIHAHNTDADALAEDIASVLPEQPRTQATILGGGGAGLAAIVACQKLGFTRIAVTSRSWSSREYLDGASVPSRMQSLGVDVFPWPVRPHEKNHFETKPLPNDWLAFVRASTLVIQATSAGMIGADAGEPIAEIVPWDDLAEHTLAYDVVYTPAVTPFLRAAMTHQLSTRGGLGMLVRQAAKSIELWTGLSPPIDVMQLAAENALVQRGQTV